MDKFGEDFAAEFVKMDEQLLLRKERFRAWAWTVLMAAFTIFLFAVTKPPTELWHWLARPFGFIIVLGWAIKTEARWHRLQRSNEGV
jgi:hypothetical protein